MFINETGIIATVLAAGSVNITGNVVATLFLILIFLFGVAIMFRIPLELFFLIILPFCLAVGAFYSSFMVPIIVIMIFLSALVAKNWLFR